MSHFDEFWSLYPKKVGKAAALRKWKSKRCDEHWDEISVAVKRQRVSDDWRKDNGRYIPHPTTWLNQERWTDEGYTPIEIPDSALPPWMDTSLPQDRRRFLLAEYLHVIEQPEWWVKYHPMWKRWSKNNEVMK